MRSVDVFTGVGGFALGFERAGIEPTVFCESDDDCVAHLARRWPHVPVFGCVRTLSIDAGFADVLVGGFPCQFTSTASRGRRVAENLWPEQRRLAAEGRFRWVVGENVLGLGDAGIDRVCGDLEQLGYTVWPFRVDVALPERQRARNRIVFVAHADDAPQPKLAIDEEVARLCEISARRWQDDPAPVGVDDEFSGVLDSVRYKQLANAVPPSFTEALGHIIVKASE